MVFSCVLDASAVILALTEDSPSGRQLLERIGQAEVHAPHLIDAEVGNVLRRKLLTDKIAEEIAVTGLAALPGLVDERYPHFGWLTRAAWELRSAVTSYDALYVALAARLDLPLLTADGRLGRAPGLPCEVEVVR